MFRKYFHNQITNLLTRFVVGTLLVVMLSGVAAPLAQAQGANGDPGSAVGNFIGNMIITVGASFAAMGGKALDFSVDKLVVGMGALVNGPELKGAIDSLWTVIRDICNLAFIFAFIYVGIRTILDADNAGTKRMLAQIIMGAFLINFSLLFTKIIIDFSNLTAIAVKDAMLQNGTFSTNFTQQLGLNGLYGIDDATKLANLTKGGGIWFSLMATLFLLVTAFVFVAGAVLLVVRFVALIFIMIFSPVLFAATLFPQTSDYAKKLLSSLISYSFFAPAYFLLMLISMRVVEALKPITDNQNLAVAINTGKTTMSGSVILFIIAIIFMVQSLLLAQKLGMAGGDKAVAWGKSLRGYSQRAAGRAAGSMTFGAAGAAGRTVIGRRAYEMTKDKNLQDKAATSWARRQQLKLAGVAADSSFDGRKVAGFGKNLGIGEGQKGGYKTIQKGITEREKKFAESLGEVDDEDELVKRRKAEVEAREKELADLKRNLNLTPDAKEKQQIREQIKAKEEELSGARVKVKEEKQRRVLGSTFDNPEIEKLTAAAQAQLEESRNLIKRKQAEAARETDPNRITEISTLINEQQKVVAKAKDDIKYFKSQPKYRKGYADTLKKTSYWKTMIWNNDSVRNRQEAGKEIEKVFKKKVSKTKEQENQDALIEAVKSSKKEE